MRRRSWLALLAVAAMAACGGGDADAGADAAMEADTSAAMGAEGSDVARAEPACEPMTDQMPLDGRQSAYDSVTISVGDGVAKVCYGRPQLRGRTMIGGSAVPYDTLWRTGANEPTTIHLNVPATIAGLEVEPGSYSLYTVPREGEEWTLIVNRSTSQWGHESQYTEDIRGQEVGRASVRAETLDSEVEELTIREEDGGPGAVLEWQSTRVHIPIEPAG